MVATLGVIWGGTFMVIELALRGITPFWLAFARIGFAALILTLIWQLRGGTLWRGEERAWKTLAISSVLNAALPFMLLSWGQQYVTSGFAGVSMATIPLFVLPLAHFYLQGERLSPRKLIGFLFGFSGVALLIGPEALRSSGASQETLGRLACLGATLCYAVNSILTRRLPPVDPLGLSAVLVLAGSALVLPIALWQEGLPPRVSLETLGYLAFLGLVPSAAANFLRVQVIRTAGSTFMSLTNFIVPICAVLLGALVLGESLPDGLIWALVLVLTGVLLSQYGALKRLFSR